MGTYGRNFEFRVVPTMEQRGGRHVLVGSDGTLPIGAPFEWDGDDPADNAFRAMSMQLATGATVPLKGQMGIGIYEWIDVHQLDPEYTTYSDRDTVPEGKLFQVISGAGIKVVLRNTVEREFLTQRTYPGRIMVAGLGATPTVEVGDLLTPGVGSDSSGYWAKTSTANEGWLRITDVNPDRNELEAVTLF